MEQKKRRGRPAKYKTIDELQQAIDDYFEMCDSKRMAKKSTNQPEDTIPYTIEGLCHTLNIDRSTLIRYEKDKKKIDFCNTIKRAKLRIQQDVMERGLSGRSNPAVTIFNLKNNFGYTDKQEYDINGKFEPLEPITGMVIT